MTKTRLIIFFAVLGLVALACGPLSTIANSVGNTIGGNLNLTARTDLWGDVPRMDGLGSSQLELPLFAKLLMQTMMSRILAQGKGSGDWAVFITDKTSADIENFYTAQMMAGYGWNSEEGKSTCFSGSEQGVEQVGLFCVFTKTEGNTDVGLMIIAAPDQQSGKDNVFFIRIENQETTPTP